MYDSVRHVAANYNDKSREVGFHGHIRFFFTGNKEHSYEVGRGQTFNLALKIDLI